MRLKNRLLKAERLKKIFLYKAHKMYIRSVMRFCKPGENGRMQSKNSVTPHQEYFIQLDYHSGLKVSVKIEAAAENSKTHYIHNDKIRK